MRKGRLALGLGGLALVFAVLIASSMGRGDGHPSAEEARSGESEREQSGDQDREQGRGQDREPSGERGTQRGREPGGAGTLRPHPCWVTLEGRSVECAVLSVPAAPGAANRVQLAVLRVRAARATTLPPLLFLGGGPGQPVIGRLPGALAPLLGLGDERDLVFVDLRGTGFSSPRLVCRSGGELGDTLERCFAEHSVEHDLAHFSTVASARDLEAVRRAFGDERWDVLATSHGTRLALTWAREVPSAVRALVLDSPVPLEEDVIAQLASSVQRALDAIFDACAAERECAVAFPELRGRTERLLTALEGAPREGVTLERFARSLLALLYTPEAIAYVPQLFIRAAQGDWALFSKLEGAVPTTDFALGAHLSAQCAEEVPFTSAAAIDRADAAVFPPLRRVLSGRTYLEDCARWPVPAARASENEPVRTEAPLLLLSGALDPITPPAYAQRIFEGQPRARRLLVRDGSHGPFLSPCGLEVTRAFLRAPEESLPVDCFARPGPSDRDEATRLEPGEAREVGESLRFVVKEPTEDELRAAMDALRR